MMTGADRQRPPILFAAVAVLALSGAVLGLLFSPLQAQEGTAPDKPTGPRSHGDPRPGDPHLGRPQRRLPSPATSSCAASA